MPMRGQNWQPKIGENGNVNVLTALYLPSIKTVLQEEAFGSLVI